MPKVMTANRLLDGAVVYLAAEDAWVTDLAQARLADTEEAENLLEAASKRAVHRQHIVGAYAMEVSLVDGRPQPRSVRELIRAARRPTFPSVIERKAS